MRLWLHNMIGRWQAKRIRTKQNNALYRMYRKNRVELENGRTI